MLQCILFGVHLDCIEDNCLVFFGNCTFAIVSLNVFKVIDLYCCSMWSIESYNRCHPLFIMNMVTNVVLGSSTMTMVNNILTIYLLKG